ncbi:MAG: enoyl-CoA hydratase-related protein [Candidatus Dadabacteria bacterium]
MTTKEREQTTGSLSYTVDSDGIATLVVHTPGSVVNRLRHEDYLALEELLDKIGKDLDMLESDDEIRAVVIVSDKDWSFISGADAGEYLEFTLADEGRSYSLRAQEVSERIEASRAPFVAAVNGACLGVGLELIIACKYRIGSNGRGVELGLNQLENGLIPCAGGMPRLARLVGTKETLDMILTGEPLDAEYARQAGLLDEIVPPELLRETARKRALELSAKELKPRRFRFGGVANALLKENPVSRKMSFDKAKKDIRENGGLHLTASRMAVEALEIGVASFNRGLHVESVYFGELAVTSYAKQLIRTAVAIDGVRNDSRFSKTAGKAAKKPSKLAVAGGEPFGPGIACLAAESGIRVRLKAKDDATVGKSLRECYDYFMGKVSGREEDSIHAERKFDLISAASDYSGFRRADIIIESAGEDPEVKRRILTDVEALPGGNFVYVSNSYAVPVSNISGGSKNPARVIGMRMSGSVSDSDLIEISIGEGTSPETVSETFELVKLLGRTPLVVKDKAGSYLTRVELAYFAEALQLLGEGVGAQDIEDAMVQFGFPEGPLSAMDDVGLDVVKQGAVAIYGHSPEYAKPRAMLDQMVSEGKTGVRSGTGFYRYHRDEKRLDRSVSRLLSLHEDDTDGISQEYIQDRLVLALVNEAMSCLEEEVIESARDGDVGAVLGLGFPAYRGGPFRYVDTVGAGDVLKKLHNLSVRYGTRYSPPVSLKNTAVGGGRFYED